MSRDTTDRSDADADCTTTTSFAGHGVEDGQRLIARTYARLAHDGDASFEPTGAFFDRLETAFLLAALETFDRDAVPPHVEAAVDDARVSTRERFADDPDTDLRTAVVPTFYRQVAVFHCAYRPVPAADV